MLLILQLRLEGFSDGATEGLWTPDGLLLYVSSLRKPLSYFACLARRYYIVDKGAPGIPHNQVDGFYRCLLTMNPREMQAMLALEDLSTKNHEWFMHKLRDKVRPQEGEGGEGGDALPLPEVDFSSWKTL